MKYIAFETDYVVPIDILMEKYAGAVKNEKELYSHISKLRPSEQNELYSYCREKGVKKRSDMSAQELVDIMRERTLFC